MLIVNTLSFFLMVPVGLYWLATRRSPYPLESLLITAASVLLVLSANWAFHKSEPFGFKKTLLNTLYIVFLAALIMCVWLPPKPTGKGGTNPPGTGEIIPLPIVQQRYDVHYNAQEKSITVTVFKEDNTVNSKQTITGANLQEVRKTLAEVLRKVDKPKYEYLIEITGIPTDQVAADVEKTVSETLGKNRCEISVQKMY